MRWDYFKENTTLQRANLNVIRIEEAGLRMDDTFYEVIFGCCGNSGWISHRAVRDRERRGMNNEQGKAMKCRACTRKADLPAKKKRFKKWKKKADLKPGEVLTIALPTWAVPRSTINVKLSAYR